MLSCYSSNAILTKVRAIFGKRLTQADYSQMARKRVVGEVAVFLKENSSYARALKNVQETEVHRGQLEALLRKDTFYKYVALRRYDFSNNPFYDFIQVKIEIDEILRKIIFILSKVRDNFIVDVPSYMAQRTSFEFMPFAKADTFDALLESLVGTPYHTVLKKLPQPTGRIDYLACESQLYRYYFDWLFRSVEKNFHGETKRDLRNILFTEIEMRNVEMIFRLKRLHQFPDEDVRLVLLPYRQKLTEERVEEMLKAKTAAEMRKASGLFWNQPDQEESQEEFIEQYTHQLQYAYERKRLRFSTNAPVAMYTFISLRNIEVENIITVIEGIRYGVSQEEIESLLIY